MRKRCFDTYDLEISTKSLLVNALFVVPLCIGFSWFITVIGNSHGQTSNVTSNIIIATFFGMSISFFVQIVWHCLISRDLLGILYVISVIGSFLAGVFVVQYFSYRESGEFDPALGT